MVLRTGSSSLQADTRLSVLVPITTLYLVCLTDFVYFRCLYSNGCRYLVLSRQQLSSTAWKKVFVVGTLIKNGAMTNRYDGCKFVGLN